MPARMHQLATRTARPPHQGKWRTASSMSPDLCLRALIYAMPSSEPRNEPTSQCQDDAADPRNAPIMAIILTSPKPRSSLWRSFSKTQPSSQNARPRGSGLPRAASPKSHAQAGHEPVASRKIEYRRETERTGEREPGEQTADREFIRQQQGFQIAENQTDHHRREQAIFRRRQDSGPRSATK